MKTFSNNSRTAYFVLVSVAAILLILMGVIAANEGVYLIIPVLAAYPLLVFSTPRKWKIVVIFQKIDLIFYIPLIPFFFISLHDEMYREFLFALLFAANLPLGSRHSIMWRPFKKTYFPGYVGLIITALWAYLILLGYLEPPFILSEQGFEYIFLLILSGLGFGWLCSVKKKPEQLV